MIIRAATQNDLHRLILLLNQLGYKMSAADMSNRINAYEGNQTNYLLVAELHDSIVGLIAFSFFELFRLPGRSCHIDSLIIDDKHRGIGIGKRLVDAAIAKAKENGVLLIDLISSNQRKSSGTHSFYKNLGFKDHHETDYTYFLKYNWDEQCDE